MFKNVGYVGFDNQPELKAKAEQLTPVLADEIHRWREDVQVRWAPHPDPATGVLDLTLSLTLPNGVSGTLGGTFSPKDLAEERLQRSRCRWVWMDLLGVLLEQQDQRIKEYLLQPAEA